MRGVIWLVCAVSVVAGCGSSSSDGAAANGAGRGGTSSAGAAGNAGSSAVAGTSGAGGSAAGSGGSAGGSDVSPFEVAGPYPVGHTTFTLTDSARSRTLPVEVWYPADESGRAAATAGTAFEDLEAPGPHHDALVPLVAAAPVPCVRKRVQSAADLPLAAAAAPLPVVAFSHCSGCMRYSSAYLAERLASRGFAVVAPDHVNNTLWDTMAGTDVGVTADFLTVRAADITFTLTQVLDASNTLVSSQLRGQLDASHVGMLGHSFGGLTTGLVVQQDTRFLAGFAVAAPLALYAPTDLTMIHVPLFELLADEDHSIGVAGNGLIQGDFTNANPPIELASVADAGHWSFSDIAGLTTAFAPGCGMSTRQSGDHEAFTYLDNDEARGIGASYVAAFFESTLRANADAATYLEAAHPSDVVTVMQRTP